MTGEEEDEVDVKPDDEVLEELKAHKLDVVRKDKMNPTYIDTQYFLELLQFIGKSVRDQ